jgi:hypothetical protein
MKRKNVGQSMPKGVRPTQPFGQEANFEEELPFILTRLSREQVTDILSHKQPLLFVSSDGVVRVIELSKAGGISDEFAGLQPGQAAVIAGYWTGGVRPGFHEFQTEYSARWLFTDAAKASAAVN